MGHRKNVWFFSQSPRDWDQKELNFLTSQWPPLDYLFCWSPFRYQFRIIIWSWSSRIQGCNCLPNVNLNKFLACPLTLGSAWINFAQESGGNCSLLWREIMHRIIDLISSIAWEGKVPQTKSLWYLHSPSVFYKTPQVDLYVCPCLFCPKMTALLTLETM